MRWYPALKRFIDIVASLAGLVVLSPVLLLATVLIKLTSPGPVFFTQIRAGREGLPFTVFKFRTMSGGRRPDPKELVPLDHPEITTVGRWLRRAKIDELPQIFNVLIGDMSLVGPRPTLMHQVEQYGAFERQRLRVRPGCTGLAQIHGGTAISWPQRIEWDVFYVNNLSLALDLQILLRTPVVILLGEERFVQTLPRSGDSRHEQP